MREVFSNPGLRRIVLAYFGTSLAFWGSALAVTIFAFDRGGAAALGLMALCRALPGALSAPFLAAVADRRSRRWVLLTTNAVHTVLLAVTAAAVAADAPLGAVYALSVLFAAVAPAYKPAQSALLPQLSRTPSELASANAVGSMLLNLGFVIGALATGVLISATSLEVVLAILAGVFALTLVAIHGVPRDTPPEGDPEEEPIDEIVEGFRIVARDPELRVLVVIATVCSLLDGAMDVFVVLIALDALDIGEAGAGYLNAAWGVGAIAGGALGLVTLGRGRVTQALLLGAVVTGAAMAGIGFVPAVAGAVLCLFMFGAGWTVLEVAYETLLQRLAPDHVISRVFGVIETQYMAGTAIGSLVAGLLAGVAGIETALVAMSVLLPAVAILWRARLARYESGAPVPDGAYRLLRAHRIFAPLPVATTERLARNMVEVRPAAGDDVITEGETGDRFYMIVEGTLDAYEGPVHRRTMGPGDGFGEIALLRGVPRTATVRANEGVVLLALEREQFLEAVTGLPHSERAAETLATERLAPIG